TPVSFTVYSTTPVTQDTVVDYAVVSPNAGFLGAASFGGALPTGQVTIAAGSSSATVSIPVASTALGAAASELLRVQITDAAGVPVLTPTADVSVNNPAVTAGTHAIPGFAEISGGGTLTQSGNNYTLDLGSVAEGGTSAVEIAVFNGAPASANQLGGAFATTGSGFTTTGTGPFSGIAAGQLQAGVDIAADTFVLGAHSETLTLHPTESNPSGFSGTLSDITLTITDVVAPCYCRGTLILTDRGEKPVEELAIGDRVNTMSGAVRPIKWIGKRSYAGRFALGQKDILPVCLKAGCLDEGVPRRDLWISPHHAMYLEGVLIEAKDLVNGKSIVQVDQIETVEYFHIELDSHDVIFAEGSLSESFVDDDSRGMFHNAHEYPALYSDAKSAPARYCAPRVQDGYELEAARARIEQRAGLRKTGGARPSGLRGFIDAVSSQGITGWAQNVDHSEAPVCLDIYANDRLIGQTLANQYREDLLQAGLGSGRHGFAFTPPKGSNASHAIEVRRSFDGAVLQLSHRVENSNPPLYEQQRASPTG
ncbi:MAG: Hint domain-containing protein, partial [Bradyrhizobium sp.]